MTVAMIFFCFILLQTRHTIAQHSNTIGIEVAKRMSDDLPWNAMRNLTNLLRSNSGSVQFRFSSPSYIYNWYCVKMFEATGSWHDNYLCTNRNIGLHWIWDNRVCRTDLKCIATAEPSDNRWNDNALCLPVQSKIELVWSYCGRVAQMNCSRLYDPAA
ncbi:unnamed protein product, partial [Rotaria sp. Silwood1]